MVNLFLSGLCFAFLLGIVLGAWGNRLRIPPLLNIKLPLKTYPNPSCPGMPGYDIKKYRRTAGLRPIFLVRDYEPRPTLPQWTAGALPLFVLFIIFSPTPSAVCSLLFLSQLKGKGLREWTCPETRFSHEFNLFPPPPPRGAFFLLLVLPHGVSPFPPLPRVSFSALQIYP